ncbi:TonB-dependent receptor plug domain-containing protein, partial [Flavobacterium sp.]|uniref:TonB-dependent receptor plug domain-containing protein n=1 Tax=Flavobacterium sp. TaxID=239 RepID=UPI00286B245E
KTQEVNVSGKSTINVVLVDEASKLSEVVVIGYGTVKKKDATGAVDQIGTKDFDNISATSPADLLRGKVSGVQVISSSGEPGAAASIRIRGNSSIRSGNEPLIVVDGVPLDGGDISSGGDNLLGTSTARNPLNFVNQNDIETMTILKDASSTAIYGSRGANGVIVITTKKGKSSEPQFNNTSSVAFSEFSSDLEIMDGNAFVKNGGVDNGSRSYDWKDAVLRSGITINNDVSFSKSSENSNTRLSFGSSTTDGIVKNTGLDKYTLALNNSNDFLGGFLKVDAKVNYAGLKDDAALISNNAGFIGNLIGTALYWNPTNAIRKPNGSYNVINDTYINPVQLLDSYKDFTNTNKILASIKTTLKFNNNLNYQFLFGVESSTSIRKSQLLPSIQIQNVAQAAIPNTSPEQKKYGQASVFNNTKFAKTFEHTLNYNKTFNDNFILDGLLGFSFYSYDADGTTTTARGFDAAQVNLIDNIEGGLEREYRATSFRNKSELQSYFGRINATLYKKLILTGTLRADGSSKL